MTETTTIRIRADTYEADLNLAGLFHFPLPAWKRYCKLIFRHDYENGEAIQALTDWFPEGLRSFEEDWKDRSRDFYDQYRDPANLRDKGERAAARVHNQELKRRVREAKGDFDHLTRMHEIFMTFKGD